MDESGDTQETPEEKKRRNLERLKKRKILADKTKTRSVKTSGDIKETQGQKLLSWRTKQFKEICGMTPAQARKWADSDADYHEMEILIQKGWSLKQAMKVLNPF